MGIRERLWKRVRSLITPAQTTCETEGEYSYRDGVSGRLAVLAFERDLRVSGDAQFSVSVQNDGARSWPPVKILLCWKVDEPHGGELVLDEQTVADVKALPIGKTKVIKGVMPIPVNSVTDVRAEFQLRSVDGTKWEHRDLPASVHRHVCGQSAEDAPADFDYEVMYRTVDLSKDWWTPVGPATRAEYESLGRGKCASLVALGLQPNSRILDVGCGTGQLTEALVSFLSPDGLYYGTDLAQPAVEFCRTKFPQPQFHFIKNEQTTIPISGVHFDFIYLGSVFTHMFPADIAKMLGELRRLMADSGCVVADAFVSPSIPDFVGSRGMIQLNEGNLNSAFREHGFMVEELSSMNWNEQCRRVIYKLTAGEAH